MTTETTSQTATGTEAAASTTEATSATTTTTETGAAQQTTQATTSEATTTEATTTADKQQRQTIAEGAGDNKDTTQVAPSFPEDWREKWSGDDKDALAILKRIPSPADMVKKLVNQEKLIRSGEHKKASDLPKDATPEQVAAWRKENGLPEKPEGYLEKLELPNGVVLGEADKPIALDYAAFAHENNMSPAEVSKNMAWYYKLQEKMIDQQNKFDDEKQTEAIVALKTEWGGDYKKNVGAVDSFLDAHAPKSIRSAILSARLPDGRKFGDHPDVMKMFASVAYDSPTTLPSGGYDGKGLESRLSELNGLIKNRTSEYYKGPNAPKLQAEYRELLDAQARQKSRAA